MFTSFSPRTLVSCFRRAIALFSFMCVFCVLCFKMAERIANVIATYQDCLLRMSFIPATSYGSATLGDVGVANKLLIAFFFSDPDVGMQFLKDVGLIRSMMACTTCGCQMTVNHTIAFVDERTGAHTNTIENTWRHVKAFLNPYNRQGVLHFPSRPVHIWCRSRNVDHFSLFLHIVANTDWSGLLLTVASPARHCLHPTFTIPAVAAHHRCQLTFRVAQHG